MNQRDKLPDRSSTMNAPRFVRGTKSRLFLYLGALSFVGLVVYVYHGAQIQLEDVRQASEKCQQQQESLSAQLQVIFEYKLRLEKSLQQEKNEHRQTKEELQNKADEEKNVKDKEILESMNKYTSLQQQHKLLKSQHEDLDEECNKVRILQLQGLEERSTLEGQVQAVQQELVQIQAAREKELENLKSNYMQLEAELDKLAKHYKELSTKSQQSTNKINYLQKQNMQLERELSNTKEKYKSCQREDEIKQVAPNPVNAFADKSKTSEKLVSLATKSKSTSPSGVQPKLDQSNFLAEPEKENADKAAMKSTTPQINPEAIGSQDRPPSNVANNVVPMPPPAKDQEPVANALAPPIIMEREHRNGGSFDWHKPENALQVPAGVVPARNDYENNHFKNFQVADSDNQLNEIGHGQDANVFGHGQNAIENPWGWNYHHPEHPGFGHQNPILHQDNRQQVDQHPFANRQQLDQHPFANRQQLDQHPFANRQQVDQGVAAANQHDNLLRFQYLNNRDNQRLDTNDVHHQRANDVHHQRGRLGVVQNHREDNRAAENKEIPRNAKNAYGYNNGDYEKDGQKNDLQLEEAEEEGDDDVDQIDYVNEAAKQNVNNNNNVVKHKRPMGIVERPDNRDGVMVNPKR